MNKETVVVSLLKPSNGRSLFTNPQHLIYHSLTYRRGKEKDYDLIVIKTLEMVSKNYYYIIRGVFYPSPRHCYKRLVLCRYIYNCLCCQRGRGERCRSDFYSGLTKIFVNNVLYRLRCLRIGDVKHLIF